MLAHRALRTLNHAKPQHVRFCWGCFAARRDSCLLYTSTLYRSARPSGDIAPPSLCTSFHLRPAKKMPSLIPCKHIACLLYTSTSFGSLAPIIPYRSCKHYLENLPFPVVYFSVCDTHDALSLAGQPFVVSDQYNGVALGAVSYTHLDVYKRQHEDILYRQWSKLMLNVGLNQVCAVYNVPYRGVQQDVYKRQHL